MSLRDKQDEFIELLLLVDSWSDRFTMIIESSKGTPQRVPDELLPFRIANCQSRTFFKAENIDGIIRIQGWSNSTIMAGLITHIREIFNEMPITELGSCEIDFHTRSGLIENVTPLRREAIQEMIGRITVLYSLKKWC